MTADSEAPASDSAQGVADKKVDEFGGEPVIKDFYEGKNPGCDCCINWIENPPAQLSSSAKEKYDKAAIRLYNVKDHNHHTTFGTVKPQRPRSLEIQSKHICKLLRPIMNSSGALSAEDDVISLDMPFAELYHNLDEIKTLVEGLEKDSDEQKHASLLPSLADRLFKDTLEKVRKFDNSGITEFNIAWTLFPKGSIGYANSLNCQRLYRIESVKYAYDKREEAPLWKVIASHFAFNGNNFVQVRTVHKIPAFGGNIRVDELPIFPVKFHSDPQLMQRCADRGRQVMEYQDAAYRECVGTAFARDPNEPSARVSFHVNGRVMIDTLKYDEESPYYGPAGDVIDCETGQPRDKEGSGQVDHLKRLEDSNANPSDEQNEGKTGRRPSAKTQETTRAAMGRHDNLLMLLSPILFGYSLKDRQWLEFPIDTLSPIRWDEGAWDHLVYDHYKKDMILTFARDHNTSTTKSTDVIAGKGEGLIFLLSGPPGTGKTLTAEALASAVKRPFYHLGIMDLGTGAKELSRNLSTALDLATEWNTITLLDEADVFMTKRDSDSLLRNELVSIFLHELEYFRGILFLTTNLFENIDYAFRSRIHLHLIYDSHGPSARRSLWEAFLTKTPDNRRVEQAGGSQCLLKSEDLDSLARWKLNGREIKNIAKTVKAWCSSQGHAIDMEHVNTAIETTSPFAQRDSEKT